MSGAVDGDLCNRSVPLTEPHHERETQWSEGGEPLPLTWVEFAGANVQRFGKGGWRRSLDDTEQGAGRPVGEIVDRAVDLELEALWSGGPQVRDAEVAILYCNIRIDVVQHARAVGKSISADAEADVGFGKARGELR